MIYLPSRVSVGYKCKNPLNCLYINFNALRNHATTNKIYREIEVRTWYIKILNYIRFQRITKGIFNKLYLSD